MSGDHGAMFASFSFCLVFLRNNEKDGMDMTGNPTKEYRAQWP